MTRAPRPQAAPRPKAAPAPKPCPICGKPPVEAYTPFCGKRCADVDLHRWLGGTYAVPTNETEEGDEFPRPTDEE